MSTLGVIGAGEIAAAVVAGLCTAHDPPPRVVLSPRNAEIAAGLAQRFSSVEVAASNQDVVDGADRIVVALRAQVAREVLSELSFPAGRSVVSLMPPSGEEWLPAAVAPARFEAHALILPSVEHHTGPIAIHPPSAALTVLFQPVGKVIDVSDRDDLLTLFALSAWVAPVYAALATAIDWAAGEGADPDAARAYAVATLASLAAQAGRAGAPQPAALATQAATPGGLNEEVMERLTAAGWFEQIESALEAIRTRLAG